MAKYHDVSQNTEAWEELRRGIPTASAFHKIISPLGKESEQREAYVNICIAEKILKRQIDTQIANSDAMDRGHFLEGDAMRYYEAQTGMDTKPGGFVTTDDGLIGCSPDRLVGDDGLLELKCPLPHTQIGYLIAQIKKERGIEVKSKLDLSIKYKPQLQGQLYVTGRKWVDILTYDPDFPDHCVTRVERDEPYLACMEKLLGKFCDEVADGVIMLADHWKGLNDMPESLDLPVIRDAQTILAG